MNHYRAQPERQSPWTKIHPIADIPLRGGIRAFTVRSAPGAVPRVHVEFLRDGQRAGQAFFFQESWVPLEEAIGHLHDPTATKIHVVTGGWTAPNGDTWEVSADRMPGKPDALIVTTHKGAALVGRTVFSGESLDALERSIALARKLAAH